MSKFKGPVEELENVLIDNFRLFKSFTCFFLSHCHSDHMSGIEELLSASNDETEHFIYCSPISRLILLNRFNVNNENIIKEISLPTVITVPENDTAPSYQVTVTPIPAGHCLGSIMFLFEVGNKTILYTGDFRIHKNDINKFKCFHNKNEVKKISKLYLDTTFLNEIYWHFPSRSEVVVELVNLVKDWISKGSGYNVLLRTSAVHGYDFAFVELARKLKCKVHVQSFLYNLFWNIPEVGCFLTEDCSKTQVHAIYGFEKKCMSVDLSRLLTIKLSAQWYRSKNESSKPIWRKFSDVHVSMCFSTHCSCSELVDFLNYLRPVSIEPCSTAVGSTEEETKEYIQQLVASWEVESLEKNWKPTVKEMRLEKNYSFKLEIPQNAVPDLDDFEEAAEKKQKLS